MAKPRQLKPWPELTGILPLLKAEEPRLKATETGHLDLENVCGVDALGLTIYLAKLSQLLAKGAVELYFSLPTDLKVRNHMISLELIPHLTEIAKTHPYRDIFSINDMPATETLDNLESFSIDIREKIIRISAKTSHRDTEISKVKNAIKEFLKHDYPKRFAHEQVMVILLELVKNTLDHSGMDAFLGLRLDKSRLQFHYADTGNGISYSVRQHLTETAKKFLEIGRPHDSAVALRLATKGSFADIIQWAFQGGNSSKIGNGVNFGFGLMLIVEAARNCGMRLSLRDADTYLLFTELDRKEAMRSGGQLSHSYIRQRCVTTSASSLLLFQGELAYEN